MGKRAVYLHIGLAESGEVVDAAVQRHRSRLAELDVLVPTTAREESFRAAIEIRRRHRAWGYQRTEVEGAWAGICRRALKGRSTVLVSQAALAGASPEQIELLVSQLSGLTVHVVLTVAAPDGWVEPGDPERDLASVVARWSGAVGSPERLHVVVVPRGEDGRRAAWHALGRVVGFGTRSLAVDGLEPAGPAVPRHPLDLLSHDHLRERVDTWREVVVAGGHDVRGDLADLEPPRAPGDLADSVLDLARALAEARHAVERLTRRNETLESRLAETGARRLRRLGAA